MYLKSTTVGYEINIRIAYSFKNQNSLKKVIDSEIFPS